MVARLSTRLRALEKHYRLDGHCANYEIQLVIFHDDHADKQHIRTCSRCGLPAEVIRMVVECVPRLTMTAMNLNGRLKKLEHLFTGTTGRWSAPRVGFVTPRRSRLKWSEASSARWLEWILSAGLQRIRSWRRCACATAPRSTVGSGKVPCAVAGARAAGAGLVRCG
jgi:hypothetical protein